jgi:glucokinase
MEFVIGLDLGAAQIAAAVADRDGRLLARTQMETRVMEKPEAGLEWIALQIKYIASQAGLDPRQAMAIGIAAADPGDLRLKALLVSRFDVPVSLIHTGQAGGLGEHRYGAGQGAAGLLYLNVGTHISGCIIAGGMLLQSATGQPNDIGHLLVDASGPPCACGARGCLEAVASGWAIGRAGQDLAMKLEGERIRILAGGDPRKVSVAAVARAAEYGDMAGLLLMDRAAKGLGMALGGLMNLLGPARVVLGGSVIQAGGKAFLAKAAEAARKQALANALCPIVTAELGGDSALYGAIALALDATQ